MSTEVLVKNILYFCCCSVAQLSLTLCNPMDCNMPGFLVLHYLPELAQTHIHWVSYAIPPSCALSSTSPPPSIFSSLRVFSNESALHIWLPMYWSFNFSISPSMNIQGWFALGLIGLISLLSKGRSRVFSSTAIWSINSSAFRLLCGPTLTTVQTPGKNTALTIWTFVDKVSLCFLICCLDWS